jgi:hypothetical protein
MITLPPTLVKLFVININPGTKYLSILHKHTRLYYLYPASVWSSELKTTIISPALIV